SRVVSLHDGRQPQPAELRYLVMALVEDLGLPSRFAPQGREAAESHLAHVLAWARQASEPLAAALGRSTADLTVVGIAPLGEALRMGFECERQMQLAVALGTRLDGKRRADQLFVSLGFGDASQRSCEADE